MTLIIVDTDTNMVVRRYYNQNTFDNIFAGTNEIKVLVDSIDIDKQYKYIDEKLQEIDNTQ